VLLSITLHLKVKKRCNLDGISNLRSYVPEADAMTRCARQLEPKLITLRQKKCKYCMNVIDCIYLNKTRDFDHFVVETQRIHTNENDISVVKKTLNLTFV
jgi:hypothetical protein